MKKVIIVLFLLCSQLTIAQFELGTTVLDEVVISNKVKKVDLYVHELVGIDSIAKVGTRIVPGVTIGNKGNIAANKKEWSFFLYIDDKLITFSRTAPVDLPSGRTMKFPRDFNKKYGSFIIKEKRKYPYKLIIKTKRKLKEFDTENNIIEGTITGY